LLTILEKDHAAAKTSNFLALPTEVRDMIYEYGIVSKQTIVPYAMLHEREAGLIPYSMLNEKVNLSLLAVNSSVRAGALQVFYEKNAFYLSWAGRDPEYPFWRHHNSLFRNVITTFEARDLSQDIFIKVFECYLRDGRYAGYTQQDIAKGAHNARRDLLASIWAWKTGLLRRMNLKTLEMDIKESKCPQGCCRLVQHAFEDEDTFHNITLGNFWGPEGHFWSLAPER